MVNAKVCARSRVGVDSWRSHDCERGTQECAMSYSFPDIAQFASKWGGPPGPQPTPSSACLVWIGLNSLPTGGSRGTRADQGVCPTIPVQFPALENYMTLGALACAGPPGPAALITQEAEADEGV